VEWVVTTGRSVEEARESALDELGVEESEAEFEVLEEPRSGLFGRVRGEARVRARIRPAQVRPKAERQRRGERRGRGKQSGDGDSATATLVADPQAAGSSGDGAGEVGQSRAASSGRGRLRSGRGSRTSDATPDPGSDEDRPPATAGEQVAGAPADDEEHEGMDDTGDGNGSGGDRGARGDTLTLDEQAIIARDFLDGLMDAFEVDGSIRDERPDEDTVEVHIEGSDLGLLVGPKGNTLAAMQELARTVIQRRTPGPLTGRLFVDVSGYRARRREALERFARQVAEDVLGSGKQKALEAMPASDRKVVHDTINEIDGVRTLSEGDEPRRRVVVVPA
jgi:spoIIIJ-associated protein